MTDYSKWSKYDADGEEQRVEVEAFKEAAAAKDLTTQAATKQLEGEGVHVVSDMASKAEAHARVAALRAQGGVGGESVVAPHQEALLLQPRAQTSRHLQVFSKRQQQPQASSHGRQLLCKGCKASSKRLSASATQLKLC